LVKIIGACSSQTSPPLFRFLISVRQRMLLYFVKPLLQITPKFFLHFFGQLLYIRFAVFQQMFYVHLTRIRMLAYNFIQMWLSKFRVIAFIVTMTTITDHINKNIGIKFLAIT